MLDSGSDGGWQPGDQEAIRKALSLPATVPCLDQQLLAAGPEQEQAIEKQSSSGPIAGSVAADGDAPLQKANVIAYDTAPLQPFAKARLLLHETSIHGDTTSAVVASHVLECFLERANYISAKESGPGVDTGDFTYIGYYCRSACLPPNPGAFWLSSDLVWQQHGRRLAADGTTLVAPCEGWIWLGNLSLLNPAGDADVDPYAQHTQFSVPEFGASYGSGGIGALVQPLIGERLLEAGRLIQAELERLGLTEEDLSPDGGAQATGHRREHPDSWLPWLRVRTLIAKYADREDFFVAEANVAEAADYIADLAREKNLDEEVCTNALLSLMRVVQMVEDTVLESARDKALARIRDADDWPALALGLQLECAI